MNAMLADASPWSRRQRAWLQALGHVVYRQGTATECGPSAVPGQPAADDAHPQTAVAVQDQPRENTPRRAPAAPATMQAGTPAGQVAPAAMAAGNRARAPGRGAPRLPDRLQMALLRASGLDPSDPATQALMAQWPLEQLRRDAAAKRALWPQLRALRRRP